MLHWLYERILRRSLHQYPRHLCFLISEEDLRMAPEKAFEVASWCVDLGIEGLTIHISSRDPGMLREWYPSLRRIASIARLSLHYDQRQEELGEGETHVVVAIGKSGREEITECIRRLARERLEPEEVDETMIESHLTFQYAPDLVIKTGGQHLTDFLIWQSVYSEIFFSDVNWKFFREVDFLRILRDFQDRKRRFGA
ncbi:MAG: undecaprenyl diphosphate synthase family protein [Methanomicrobiales archaeon]|nr:undecaprenyl diphosphate synthase family protein [Methanomicrobiales archaeon]